MNFTRAQPYTQFMEKCIKSDLILEVKAKRTPRFKAGSDLHGKVNLVTIDLNEEIDEESELVELKLHLTSEHCSSEVSDC